MFLFNWTLILQENMLFLSFCKRNNLGIRANPKELNYLFWNFLRGFTLVWYYYQKKPLTEWDFFAEVVSVWLGARITRFSSPTEDIYCLNRWIKPFLENSFQSRIKSSVTSHTQSPLDGLVPRTLTGAPLCRPFQALQLVWWRALIGNVKW
jgi:hypothetical protein